MNSSTTSADNGTTFWRDKWATSASSSSSLENDRRTTTGRSHQCMLLYEFFSVTDRWVMGVVVLPVALVGLVTTIISIHVFSGRSLRRAKNEKKERLINTFLLALCVSDILALLTALVGLSLPRVAEITSLWNLAYFSLLLSPVTNVLQNVAHVSSTWITVGMQLYRFVGICFPLKASRHLHSAMRVRVYLATVFAVAVLYNAPKYFEIRLDTCLMIPIRVPLPWASLTPLGRSLMYRTLRSWIYMGLFYALPFAILFVVNALMILSLHRSRQLRNNMSQGNRQRSLAVEAADQKEVRISFMLVLIVLCFLLCNTPAFAHNVLVNLRAYGPMNQLAPWMNLLLALNPTLNTLVYVGLMPSYRNSLRSLCCCDTAGIGGGGTTVAAGSSSHTTTGTGTGTVAGGDSSSSSSRSARLRRSVSNLLVNLADPRRRPTSGGRSTTKMVPVITAQSPVALNLLAKKSPIIVRRPVVVVLGEELEMKEKNGFSGPSTLPSNKE